MTPEEIQQLAARIAERLRSRATTAWIPGPVRPEPPGPPTPGQLKPWTGAAQVLSDVAPVPGRKTQSGKHRPAYDAITAAWRGAAAGRAPAPMPGGRRSTKDHAAAGRTVPIGISNRHVHITQPHVEQLFGASKHLIPERPISQPGQFAAHERVRVVGPQGGIEEVRIVGPTRAATQVELSTADCRRIGLRAPLRHSGNIDGSAGVRLEGPAGSVDLRHGAIVAARHMHVAPDDAARLGVTDGDRVTLVVGSGDRFTTLHDVLVRSGASHATEVHLDTDEASAFGVATGDVATIVGRPQRRRSPQAAGSRPLLTERDVAALAATGAKVSASGPYLVTPSARDRAKALGIWTETS